MTFLWLLVTALVSLAVGAALMYALFMIAMADA